MSSLNIILSLLIFTLVATGVSSVYEEGTNLLLHQTFCKLHGTLLSQLNARQRMNLRDGGGQLAD